jgi:MFS superfamily sulfate permease-like transporter
VAVLGRIPGTRRFSDIERHADNERIPGALIFRPEASVLYFNSEHVHDTILARVAEEDPHPRLVVLDLSNSAYVDYQGASALVDLAETLSSSGIRLQVVEAHADVRDMLRAEGVAEKVGGIDRFRTTEDVIERFQADGGAAPSLPSGEVPGLPA